MEDERHSGDMGVMHCEEQIGKDDLNNTKKTESMKSEVSIQNDIQPLESAENTYSLERYDVVLI